MQRQHWVDPNGGVYQIEPDQLGDFCRRRKLNASNMQDHVAKPSSDQKNGGWRLVERLRWIQSVAKPTLIVPALGTLHAFHANCLHANDGRENLVDRDNLRKLLAGSYGRGGGGKPYNGWRKIVLPAEEAERRLLGGIATGNSYVGDAVSTSPPPPLPPPPPPPPLSPHLPPVLARHR